MNRLPWVFTTLLLLMLLSVPASAAEHTWDHRMSINGQVSQPGGGPARWATVGLDCSDGATDPSVCGLNPKVNTKTSFSGNFELGLHIEPGDGGKQLVLLIDGQSFNHTLDLLGEDGEAGKEDRSVNIEFELDHKVSHKAELVILALFLLTIVATIVGYFIIRRRGATPHVTGTVGRAKRSPTGDAPEMINCPKCEVSLKAANLSRHLTKVHGWSKQRAAETADEQLARDED